MAKRNLQINAGALLIPDYADGHAFWKLVREFVFNLPGYQPQSWAADSSLRGKLSLLELRSLAEEGATAFSWIRNSQPRGEGSISKRTLTPAGLEHAKHLFRISVKDDEQMDWLISYLCYTAASDGVDFAYCGAVGHESEGKKETRSSLQSEGHLSTLVLKRSMPDLFWAQIFGKAYVDLFGLDKLLSSPAYQVEQLTQDAVYVQLTESIFDVRDRPAEVHARKQLVKRHLDENIFLDSSRPATHLYRVPGFAF
ncbi:MAG: hypothetical protein ACN6PR_18440 [Achromobacter sp.]